MKQMMMKIVKILAFTLAVSACQAGLAQLAAATAVASNPVAPNPVAPNTVVLTAGDFSLSKADYEALARGFDRSAGAVLTGGAADSLQSGQDMARLLALVSEAQRRKIDQRPDIQALMRVRGYVLLSNALLKSLNEEVKKDEAGTRALWESEKNNLVNVHSRQILFRYQGVKSALLDVKGMTRSEAQAKALAALVQQKLQAGADFATLAKASSDDQSTLTNGGELPPFSRGAMVSEFEAVAFSLPIGVASQPFKTQYGYHVIQVTERSPFPFEQVRATLEFTRAKQKLEEIASAGSQLNNAYFKP